jgi:hypothetical protein
VLHELCCQSNGHDGWGYGDAVTWREGKCAVATLKLLNWKQLNNKQRDYHQILGCEFKAASREMLILRISHIYQLYDYDLKSQ